MAPGHYVFTLRSAGTAATPAFAVNEVFEPETVQIVPKLARTGVIGIWVQVGGAVALIALGVLILAAILYTQRRREMKPTSKHKAISI